MKCRNLIKPCHKMLSVQMLLASCDWYPWDFGILFCQAQLQARREESWARLLFPPHALTDESSDLHLLTLSMGSECVITPLFFLPWFLQGYTSLPEMILEVSCALCVCCYFIDSKLKAYSLVSIIFSNKFGAFVFIYFVHMTELTLCQKKKKRRLQENDENKKWEVKRSSPYLCVLILFVCFAMLSQV